MRAGVRALLLVLAAGVCASYAQTSNNSHTIDSNKAPQQRSIWEDPIRFSTKGKDACTMVVSGAGNYTRLRVSCKGPGQSQNPGRSYYCDFQGKPHLCRAYNTNPRHYFTQMMWDLRKLDHACQGPKVFRPLMCKKYSEDAHMTFLAVWPKATATKPSKPGQDQQQQQQRKPTPAQPKPAVTKPVKPQPPLAGKPLASKPQASKPHAGKKSQPKKPTPKPSKPTPRPTESAEAKTSRLAQEYCWKSFHGICSYFIGWFQN